MKEPIFIPEDMAPDICPECWAPVVNKRRARLVNPTRRKRVPFCCAHSKFLGLGECPWQGWISPRPISVGIVLWKNPKSEAWFVLVEKRGIEPGKGQEAFVAGFVEPGHTGPETCVHELQQEVGIRSRAVDWHFVWQTSPHTNPLLLLSFYAKVLESRHMPKLRPDGHETLDARFVHVDRLATDANLMWPSQINVVHFALDLVESKRLSSPF